MRIIKTLNDIELLKEAATLSNEILLEIEAHFRTIYKNIGEPGGMDINDFSLQNCGIIVYLEAGDNVKDLQEIGLNPQDGGLLGATPEWIDEQAMENGTLVTACILFNNEYCISALFLSDAFSEEVQNWISDNI